MESIAYIGLGANLGQPERQLEGARAALEQLPRTRLLQSSSLYRSAAVGGPAGQPDYLNAVIELATGLTPSELLCHCLEIEGEFGRQRLQHWGPRSLDLDLLLVDRLLLDEPDLILPHPRLHLRRFVLEPLLELAPELQHPRLRRPLKEFLPRCLEQGVTRMGAW